MKRWREISFPRTRTLLLRLALGSRGFDYMNRTIKFDKRTPGARLIDIVVRQDGREERIEADWVKTIAKIIYHVEVKPIPSQQYLKKHVSGTASTGPQ